MGQSPIENSRYSLSDEARAALAGGDIESLLKLHKTMFGGFRMEADEDGGGGDGDDGDDGGDDPGDGDDNKDEDGGADKSKRSISAARAKELHDENSRRRNENKQLRDEQAKLAAKLKKFEDADKSETEKITGERDELKARVEKLSGTNTSLALQVAFLQDNTNTWHNPKAALKLLDLDGVEIDEEGEVTGLEKAIEKLAKENPYLLKNGTDDKDGEGESGAPRNQASGQPVSKKAQAQRKALESKYRL